MKKNKLSTLMVLGLFLVMICIISVSGTYAKYTSTVTGTDTATIAKWSWSINNETLTKDTQTYTLNLFDTVNEADTTTTESDVTSGMIAPGTGGKTEVTITNNSDVNATYTVTFSETNTLDIPIEYSIDGQNWGEVADLNITSENIKIGATATIPIMWRWAYDGDDTAIGFAAATATEIEVQASLTVTQAD